METRARRQSLRAAARSLPSELWLLILSYLDPQQATRAAAVCTEFAKVAGPATHRACHRAFPQHANRLNQKLGVLGVQRVLTLISQHEAEAKNHPDVQKSLQLQRLVLPEHRQIAVEWLIEVAWDWQLESTVVYRGAQYLDHYLATIPVPALSKFQMLAISSLRTALKHSSKLAERERARLPYKHWAEVTDGACTEAEVRSTCSKLERLLQQQQRSHPNAKQRLRYLWYRLYDASVVKQEHVYAYMLASFLLHLSLLDSNLSAVTPTLLATAALSLALEVFSFPPWPQALQEHCLYAQQELQEVQGQLRKAQEELPAKQLRALWVHSYSYIGTNPAQQPAYSHLQLIVSSRGKLEQLNMILSGLSNAGSNSSAAAVASLAAAAAAAVVADGSGATDAATALAGLPPAAAAAAAAAGPVDGTVIVGVVPAAATAVAAAVPLPVAPVGRVTRAAAAAGHQQQRQHLQQRQNHPQATVSRPHTAATAVSGRQAGSSSQQQQQLGSSDRLLPTPQRTSLTPLSAVSEQAGRHIGQAAGAAPVMAGLGAAVAAVSDQQAVAGTSSSAAAGSSSNNSGGGAPRRCATRELPARRAVASSRYGGLASACRGGLASNVFTAGSSAAAPGNGSNSNSGTGSSAAAAAVGGAADGFRIPHAAVAAGGSFTSTRHAAGSTTPSSPQHAAAAAAAGHRGLAALFAGAACSSAAAAGAAMTRSRAEGLQLLHSCRLDSEELERRSLLEGTPQPPQLLSLQQQHRLGDALAAKHGSCTRGAVGGSSNGDGHRPGGSSGSHMLAACQAAASAAASAQGN